MVRLKHIYISLIVLFLVSAPVLGGQQVSGDDLNQDFWWDYGETDERHATFAPAMDKELSRKTRVEVVLPEKHKVFVSGEYLQIRYLILVPFDVRIDEKKLPARLDPFEITEFYFGPRKPIKNERDMEQQDLLLTLHQDESFPYDTYVLPSFDLHYQYDTIVGKSRIPQKKTVATGEILLEKVPVYVRVLKQRDTGFLWDVFPCFLELHTDNSVTFLNLEQYSDEDPLLQFKPDYPFMVRGQKRSEYSGGQFRVIRYEFMVAVQDFRGQPFTLAFPRIAWQQKGAPPGIKKIITPKSPSFFIKNITQDSTRITPLKKYIPEPSGERYRLLGLPLQALWLMLGLSLFWFSFLYWQHYRKKTLISKVPLISRPAQPTYDKWPWQILVLGIMTWNARRAFQKSPDSKNCARLRELLARRAAIRISAKNKITTAQVCALTAGELAQLGGRKHDIAELHQLEKQLESGHYEKLRDTQPGERK